MKKTIRIATRQSKLALAQADIIKQRVLSRFQAEIEVEILPLITKGDLDLEKPLYEIGGKGVFIKEVEQALIDQKADIAVHSLKDITSNLAPGLVMAGFTEPEGYRDVFISSKGIEELNKIPLDSTIATGSLRRKALLKFIRPDLKTCDIRGNVISRLEKIKALPVCGTLLSEAGLIRLGIDYSQSQALDPNLFIPAPGQGVIGLETREDDSFARNLCRQISDAQQFDISTAELEFLMKVGLDCRSPLGLYTQYDGKNMAMKLFLANERMDKFLHKDHSFPYSDYKHEVHQLANQALAWISEQAGDN
ncbi:porphobilinogen deaminase [Legionella birminghamensis]|uniref:Hydroxymethylbilane synthase n=1 Tax=Legionella birminghamensis TaxID=28083 RepID=A0A378I7Y6_9GAMM|nr:hydroxymethylbilane synthase [Legionella birminghamensis]KTC71552.1 porphobilinogen deaminase [Legionella birminghamensis]STX30840.1 porphobilinogen deaminase [Legionella birminghamensis]